MRLLSISATTATAVVLLLASSSGSAQTRTAASTAIDRGRTTFIESCAVCHGERGRGDGTAAPALKPRPVDLTSLTKKNGSFPAAHLDAVLKAADTANGHTPMMTIWRALFLAQANGNRAEADARVSDLIKFIESIQAK